MKHIAIFPGAFKPPTKGHFQAVVELANNKFKVANYDVEEVPAVGNKTKKVAANITGKAPDFKIDEVLVLYGTQERNGITAEISAAIWDIYKKHLPANVKIAPANGNPAEVAKDIIVANPDNQYYIPVGLRRPEDLKDLGRLNLYKNLPNAKGVAVYGVPEEGQDLMSATFLRNALLAGNDDEAKKYLPSELTAKELSQVIDIIKSTLTIEERMNYAMEQVMLGMLTEEVDFTELETTLDTMFDDLDIDINFTKHFKERVLERGLTEEDILDLMSKIHDKYGDALADLPKDSNRVFTHLTKLVDISSAMGSYDYDGLKDLYLTTAYKRKDRNEPEFRTNASSPKLKVAEVTMGLPVAPIAVLPSEVTQYMRDLAEKIKAVLPEDVLLVYNGQAITITPKYYNKPNAEDNTPNQDPITEYQDHAAAINYVPYIAGILEHMLKKGMTVLPLPEIKTREDEENAANVFGRTAYYDPTKKEIVLYVTGRHPKDVLRSFCHEMIHHMQNLEGRLPLITTTNTQEDAALNEIEKEAHYLGSMTMREYEDSIKSQDSLDEGTKYRSIVADVRRAVNDALNILLSGKKLKGYNVKTKREPTKKDLEFAEKYGMSPLGAMLYNEYQSAYLGEFTSKSEKGTKTEDGKPVNVGVSLKFAQTDEVEPGKFHIDGEAGSDEGEIDIILAFNPADGTNMLQRIQPILTDLIRHETEHLTQSGVEVRPDKWMRKDEARRRAIRQDPESWYKYYMLPKEVDANIQGLYTKSKYEKKDFQSTVDQYLEDLVQTGIITVGNKQKIYDLWKSRIPQIGGIPNLK